MKTILRKISVPTIIALVLALTGFVNLATGLTSIFRLAPYVEGVPEYLTITPVQRTSGILSVLLGILLIALGKGLYQRRRRSWAVAMVVLVILMANNLYRGTTPQTAILSGALIVGLLALRKHFTVSAPTKLGYGQIVALASVLFALSYGIVGSYLLREQFEGIDSWTDAVYFTFVTYSTLGYGDILPHTDNAKVFATTMIPLGLASFITALTAVIGPAVEERVKGVLSIMQRFQHLKDHVVVCGYSNVSASAIDQLREDDVPYVVVDDREDIILHLRSKGHEVLSGDASRKEALEAANLGGASALISAFDSDALNILVAVTARKLRDAAVGARFRIVVRVEDEENVDKAREVGADEVISPSTTAGRMMATKALGKQTPQSA